MISVHNLSGPKLDRKVAECEGVILSETGYTEYVVDHLNSEFEKYSPSSNWSIGGPIIEREGIDIQQVFSGIEGSFAVPVGWQAIRHTVGGPINPPRYVADTPLVAAMRCYVASK